MPQFRITTPEQVYFHYEIAGLATRAVAYTIDLAVLTGAKIGAYYAINMGVEKITGRQLRDLLEPTGGHNLGEAAAVMFFLLLLFGLDFGYYVFFESMREGQSPGKRLMGIRVMAGGGGRLRFPEVLIRNLVRIVDSLPYFMLLGGVVALLDKHRRRLGDLAADTIVVRDATTTIPSALLAAQARINSFQSDLSIRNRILARVTRAERDLMMDLMVRRDELDPDTREELFAAAATHFRRRYGLPDDMTFLTDEQTVMNLALVVQGTKLK